LGLVMQEPSGKDRKGERPPNPKASKEEKKLEENTPAAPT